jgi:hypothetical protein
VELLLEDFGVEYIDLVQPVWEVQANALEHASWMKSARKGDFAT